MNDCHFLYVYCKEILRFRHFFGKLYKNKKRDVMDVHERIRKE